MGLDLERLRPWQWAIIGALGGAAIFAMRSSVPADPIRTISQDEFDERVFNPPVGRMQSLENLLVKPGPDTSYTVTGGRLVEGTSGQWAYEAFTFTAASPYQPTERHDFSSALIPSIREFLDTAQKTNPALSYQYAWWSTPGISLSIYICTGAILLGVAWPLLLRFIIGAGYGKKVIEKPYDLSRFGKEKEATEPKKPAVDPAILDAAIEQMMTNAADSPDVDVQASSTSAEPKIVQLSNQPQLETISAAEQEKKDFAGEFYPTIVRKGASRDHYSEDK